MQCFNQFLLFSCPTLKRIPYFCNAVERKEDRLTEKVVQASAESIKRVAQSISFELGYSKSKKI